MLNNVCICVGNCTGRRRNDSVFRVLQPQLWPSLARLRITCWGQKKFAQISVPTEFICLSSFVCADWTFLTRCWDSSWTQWSQDGQRSCKEVEGTASAQVLKPHYTEEDNDEPLHRQPNTLQNARSHKILKYYDNSVSSSKCVQCITIFDLDLKTNIKSISYSE